MPTAEQIKQWDQALRAKGVQVGGTELDKAVVVALARRKRGVGIDAADPFGAEAMALVEQALA